MNCFNGILAKNIQTFIPAQQTRPSFENPFSLFRCMVEC